MGKIFYIMGKSSSGKDSIYRQLEALGCGIGDIVEFINDKND